MDHVIKYYDFYFWTFKRKINLFEYDCIAIKMDIAKTDLEKKIQ